MPSPASDEGRPSLDVASFEKSSWRPAADLPTAPPEAVPPEAAPRGHGFGTTPVFLAAISTILGAIMFLRFGYAVAHTGLLGALAIVALGHMVTVPTAMALSEIATNRRVEGGGSTSSSRDRSAPRLAVRSACRSSCRRRSACPST